MPVLATIQALTAGLLSTLLIGASHAQASFTLVRAQIELPGTSESDGDVVEQVFGSSYAMAGQPGWYGKGRASYGNSGAYAIAAGDNEAFAETWWVDAFNVTGGSGAGELTIAISVSGTILGKGRANYALFSRSQAFGVAELASWLDCPNNGAHCIPNAPLGAHAVIPMQVSFPASGSTVLTASIPFTYGQTFYLASYFGVETWGSGEANFYGSAHVGLSAPLGGEIGTASGTLYPAAAAVPEAATWALMSIGLPVLWALGRRRRAGDR